MSSLIIGAGILTSWAVAAVLPAAVRRWPRRSRYGCDKVREGTLEYRLTGGGPAYFLAGRRLRPGDEIEAACLGGFVEGAFSWSGDPEDLPRLLVDSGDDVPTRAVLRPTVRCCWPEPAGRASPGRPVRTTGGPDHAAAPVGPTSAAAAG